MKYHSKSSRVAEVVLADLAGGRFRGETFLPSEQRLAEYYSSSRHTIRRIIGNLVDDGVLTRCGNQRLQVNPEKLREVEAEHSAPEQITLAFAYAAYPDAMISSVTTGLKQYVAEHDMKLQLLTSPTGHGPMLRTLEHAAALGIQGIFVLPYFMEEYVDVINKLMDSGVAVATLSELPGVQCSSVCGDDYSGAFVAVSRLIEKYNRPVYFFGPRGETSSSVDRYNAYCRAMTEAGFDEEVAAYTVDFEAYGSNPESWPRESKLERPADMARAFLKQVETPVSLFCMNDYMAQGVYRAAARLKLEIGKDVVLIGFGDLPMAQRLEPPLTTIRSAREQIGYQAAKLLHGLVKGELNTAVHLRLPMELIERASC